MLSIVFPVPTFTNPNEVSSMSNAVPVFVICCPLPTVYTPTASFFPTLIVPEFKSTFPPLEYIATDPSPTIMFLLFTSSNPYIPTAFFPIVISPLFISGFVPVPVAFVYIATLGSASEAESPNVITLLFTVSYEILFFATFAYIPTFLSFVLVIVPAFSNTGATVIFPGSYVIPTPSSSSRVIVPTF